VSEYMAFARQRLVSAATNTHAKTVVVGGHTAMWSHKRFIDSKYGKYARNIEYKCSTMKRKF
jgi:hypothetical protein